MTVLQPRTIETVRFSLFPFRSPLLWESRLISFPLGTEMFHFPRLASLTGYRNCFRWVAPFRDPRIIGYLAPPRGLSQLIASFIAFGAKASAYCSFYLTFSKKPLDFLCSIVKELAALLRQAGLDSGSKPSLRRLLSKSKVSMVGLERLELSTSRLSGVRSNHLSYRPVTLLSKNFRSLKAKSESGFSLKEVIQPQVPLRLPCYDFTPITGPTFGRALPCGLDYGLRVFPTLMV